jgi:carboxyl-terminal processing protease
MLREIKSVLKSRYYDKNFRGIDLDARFKAAEERVKSLDTNWQIFRAIGQVLIEFDDSHTTFYPPNRANRVEYGFSMQMIGAHCFVTDVKKGSDAEKGGLLRGDRILAVGEYTPTRENLWKINYILYALDPQESIKLTIAGPGNDSRELTVRAKFKSIEERQKEAEKKRKEKQSDPYKCQVVDAETIACKLKTFSIEKKYVDKMMSEAAKYKKLILDLRGNGGGFVKIEEYLVGHFFDREIKIADFVNRGKTKERIAKPQKERAFGGDLVVLIDSNSASASEVFSRVIQLQRRGKIVGDVSAGAVMTSNMLTMANSRGVPGFETFSFFGLNVTVADLIMSDGSRLEKVGVIPDHPVGPTGFALLKGSDPVLAFAAGLHGVRITSEAAGKFNFLNAKEEDEDEEESGETEN